MSRSLGAELPADLRDLLSQRDLPRLLGRGVPLITIDERGRPHPMLASYLELRAVDTHTLRVVVAGGSRTAANLDARSTAAILLIDEVRTVYVKCRAAAESLARGELARFTLCVEDVLEDSPAAWEVGLRITGGIAYAPPPALDAPTTRAILALLDA